MKRIITWAVLSSPALWAIGPQDISDKKIRIDMNEALMARSGMQLEPQYPWYLLDKVTDFIIDFPSATHFTTKVQYSVGISHNVQVSYTPDTKNNSGYINLQCPDFKVEINLTYTSNTGGTAYIAWHQAGNTWHIRHIDFCITDDNSSAFGVEIPEEIIFHDPELILDDGLQEIHSEITHTNYRSATEKLYQKRLDSLLPMVMMLGDASFTTPDYKGNTALHYACGLSHVALVRWLVEHGADLESRTEKGASVDACIGGKNAKEIKAIIREARAWRDTPYRGASIKTDDAKAAATWLETEFSGHQLQSPTHLVLINQNKAEQCARIVYRFVKQGNEPMQPGVDPTDTLGVYITRVKTAKVSEEMFVGWILQNLKQRRYCAQQEYRGAGLTLARLPHMILTREDEGMTTDGATATYRAACEGNVELLQWLIDHGATRELRDAQGSPTQLPPNTPNHNQIQKILNNESATAKSPQLVAGCTFIFSCPDFDEPVTAVWTNSNNTSTGEVLEDEDWTIIRTTYTKTGDSTATVTRDAQWSPGGAYADGWSRHEFKLNFTSPIGGTATCTKETKHEAPQIYSGTFTLQ